MAIRKPSGSGKAKTTARRPPAKLARSNVTAQQTELFNQKGQPRDFRNPAVSANRQPTTSPAPNRSSAQATPPNKPSGGFGNNPKGQLELNLNKQPLARRSRVNGQVVPGPDLRGSRPAAKPSAPRAQAPAARGPAPGGNFRAPNVPAAGKGIQQFSQGAKDWLASSGTEAATKRALAATGRSKLLSGLGKAAGVVGVVAAMADEINEMKDRNKTFSWNRPKKPAAKPQQHGPFPSDPITGGRYVDGSQQQQFRQPPAPKSPAIGAPVHASPSAFGSGQGRSTGSAFVGSSIATPPRPSSPAQAALAGAPASETYRDGGKGLYQGTQAYRDAVGGSGNPLLNRFRNEMGLDPATGAKPQQEGQPQQAPTAAKAEPKMSAQYDGNDEPGRLGQAENPMQALMELLKRNKLKIQVN